MGEQRNAWRDDPVRSVEQETLGISHVAESAARLIAETHSLGVEPGVRREALQGWRSRNDQNPPGT